MDLNRSYDELELEDIENQVSIKNKNKIQSYKYNVCMCITYPIIVFLFFQYINTKESIYTTGKDHLLKENYNHTKRQLRIMGHGFHGDPCTRYQFGCCEIYSDCSYDNSNITDSTITDSNITDYNTYTFEGYWYHIIKEDEIGSNCPRMVDLIRGHNENYPQTKSCKLTDEGCCQLDTRCDSRLKNTNDHQVMNLVETMGTGCPSVRQLMIEYRRGYPSKSFWDNEFMFLLIFSLVMCYGCFQSNRKR